MRYSELRKAAKPACSNAFRGVNQKSYNQKSSERNNNSGIRILSIIALVGLISLVANEASARDYSFWNIPANGNVNTIELDLDNITVPEDEYMDLITEYIHDQDAQGVAIYNKGVISNINGYVHGLSGELMSKFIDVADVPDSVPGGFVTRYTYYYSDLNGASIFNDGTISSIDNLSITNTDINFIGFRSSSYSKAEGGALYNSSIIDSITNSEFLNNNIKVNGDAYAYGGALYNSGTIKTISSTTFNNNKFSKDSNWDYDLKHSWWYNRPSTGNERTYGGAIYNTGTINLIDESEFQNNSANYGGAIYNAGNLSSVAIVDGTAIPISYAGDYKNGTVPYFEVTILDDDNSTLEHFWCFDEIPEGTTGIWLDWEVDKSKLSQGLYKVEKTGSIILTKQEVIDILGYYPDDLSDFQIGTVQDKYIYPGYFYTQEPHYAHPMVEKGGITNSSFVGNSATYHGGAIYTTKDIVFISTDNHNFNIKDNYISEDNGATKNYEAIYVDSNSATLTFKAQSDGKFSIYDYIDGKNGYDIKFTGDNTGTVNLYNDIKNGDVFTDTVTMNIANNQIHNYNLKSLTSNANTNWKLDMDINGTDITADTITTSDASSSGTVTINGLNIIGGRVSDLIDLGESVKVQILKNATGNNDLQLALDATFVGDNEKIISTFDSYSFAGLNKDVAWDDNITQIKTTSTVKGMLDLATTSTTNDSIGVKVTSVDVDTDLGAIDTLKAINQFETTDDRTFTASTSDETYTVTDDIGETASGNLTVQGVADGETRSTLDFDNHTGFELANNDTTLTLKDAKIKNADALVSGTATENVKVVLDNVDLDGSNGGISTFGDVEIKGNSTISDNVTVFGANSKLDIDGTDEVTLDSALTGAGTSTLAITNGTINLTQNAQVTAFDTTITDANLNIAKESSLAGLNTTFEGTNNLNIANDSVGTLALGNVNLNGLVKMQVDADLAGKQMDKLTATSATVNGGSIEVNKINLLSPTTDTKTSLLFTNNTNLANVVSYTGEGTIAYSPIFKYKTSYSVRDGQGYFDFVLPSKPGPGPSPSPTPSDFNPAILATPVMAQAGMQASMNMTMNYAFQHSDGFTKLRAMDRFASINKNKYALSTDFNENLSKMGEFYENKGAWVRPYASFENVRLKNGPRVDAISYGTLVGFDTDFKELRHGWDTIFTGYLGYNGAHLSYPNTSTTMNGGVLGGTQTWYKGNFWTALTATTGASVAESNTMYGHESNVSIMAGVGSKTGYNFEFADGRFIMQPIWFMNYSMIKTIDYTNAAGVRIDSDPLHTIQLNPSIRFIGNLNHGWQPYASVGMVWNLMNKTHVEANGVRLPEMSVKPYVEYGVGVQKQIGDRFTGYFQAMMRNGGRNGIALTGGFRWALGRDGKPIEKVQNGKPVIKVQNSTRKILKSFSKSNVI